MKTKKWQAVVVLILLSSLSGCKEKEKKTAALPTQTSTIDTAAIRYTPPAIPENIKHSGQAVDYLTEHYWDSINFADTLYLHTRNMMEQAWCNYCDLLNKVPAAVADKSISKVIKSAAVSRPMFKYLTGLAEKYLYDPNSPMRNEDHYIPVLREMLASPSLNEAEKIRPEAQLKLALKNRVGKKAGNFRYTLASGQKGYLYQIKADYILLFFNNPGCHACRETISFLKQAPSINQFFDNGKLKILSLYPDEEIDNWKKHLNEFPAQWICAYDKEMRIREKQIYDLKAIPTLYLLNNKKVVLLKDATPGQVEYYLQTH